MICPTPYKHRWATPEQADGHRLLMLRDPRGARKQPDPARLHVYHCRCGFWHVGHSHYPVAEERQAS